MHNIDVSNGFDLGCFHYEVRTSTETNKDLVSRDKYGECSSTMRRVSISTDFSEDQYHNTFIHEIIEAANVLSCNNKIKHDEITNLANGLAQIFKSLGLRFVYKDK